MDVRTPVRRAPVTRSVVDNHRTCSVLCARVSPDNVLFRCLLLYSVNVSPSCADLRQQVDCGDMSTVTESGCEQGSSPGGTRTQRSSGVVRSVELLAHLCVIATTSLLAGARAATAGGVPCVFEGHLTTDKNWFGYLANISVVTTARMTFEFTYAADRCCQNVLFYTEDQTSIISARMNCWQKEYLLRPEDDQILRLTPRFSWSGESSRCQ